MDDQEPRNWDEIEPTDWQTKILFHIMTINRELGDVVRDLAWVKKLVKMILVIIVLLVLAQGDEVISLLRKALDLLM